MKPSNVTKLPTKLADEIKAMNKVLTEMQTLVGEVNNQLISLKGSIKDVSDLKDEEIKKCDSSKSKKCDHGEKTEDFTNSIIEKSEELIKSIRKIDKVQKKVEKLIKATEKVEKPP
uniref:Chromosome partition protein Smc n=1 Tax=Strongyloides stercoralis TaxID=6248 RepID=A0A0K0E480_STRER